MASLNTTHTKRRPVPKAWREDNHALTIHCRTWGQGFRRVSRAKGVCSCGERWPKGKNMDNMTPASVRAAYADHVERAYHDERAATNS
jgi:hypothetical protein